MATVNTVLGIIHIHSICIYFYNSWNTSDLAMSGHNGNKFLEILNIKIDEITSCTELWDMFLCKKSAYSVCDKEWNKYLTTRRKILAELINPIFFFLYTHAIFPILPSREGHVTGQQNGGNYEWHLHAWNTKPAQSSTALSLILRPGWIQSILGKILSSQLWWIHIMEEAWIRSCYRILLMLFIVLWYEIQVNL